MVHVNMFGTGRTLQAAIWAACGMAFILFGTIFPSFYGLCGHPISSNNLQATTKASSPASSRTKTSWNT